MMTTKKQCRFASLIVVAAMALLLTACGPPGGRELHQAEADIEAKDYADAISQTREALRVMTDVSPATQSKAWNLLGLAYLYDGKLDSANQAFIKAQRLSRNNASVFYNLASLQMRQGDLRSAEASLNTYCMLRPRDPQGFAKRGIIYLRSSYDRSTSDKNRFLDMARKDFEAAEKLGGTAESANGTGIVDFLRRAPGPNYGQAAATNFSLALKRDTNFYAALLNLAVVSQVYLNNPTQAVRFYRDYLAAVPAAPRAKEIALMARDIEVSQKISITPVSARTPPRTAPAPVLHTNPPSQLPVKQTAVESNAVVSPPPAPAPSTKPSNVTQPQTQTYTRQQPPAQPAVISHSPPVETVVVSTPPENPPAAQPLPQTSQPPPSENQPQRQLDVHPQPSAPPANAAVVSNPPPAVNASIGIPAPVVSDASRGQRKTITQKLNPMGWFSGKAKPGGKTASSASDADEPPPVPPGSHFEYPPPITPIPGDRNLAHRLIAEAIRARQLGDPLQSVRAYRDAVAADPSSYDASYGLGLALVDAHDYKGALVQLFHASNLKADSADARYAFAWVLQKRGYSEDAVRELGKLLAEHPNDVRGHLLLGNLYADRLDQPKLAREQYLQAMQIDPKNAQATNIQTWLEHN